MHGSVRERRRAGSRVRHPNGKRTYTNTFFTSLEVTAANVADIARAGRARWKIENEGFNVARHGYNIKRNFGHGRNGSPTCSELVRLRLSPIVSDLQTGISSAQEWFWQLGFACKKAPATGHSP